MYTSQRESQGGFDMKITRCQGEGQGSCKRCKDSGKWNRSWMCFLYKINGLDGCYCKECVEAIKKENKIK